MTAPVVGSAFFFKNVDDLDFARAVFKEVARARAKFPGNEGMLAALMEEVGELAKALLERDRNLVTDDVVWAEAVQVAAMAARLAMEGSAEFKYRTSKLQGSPSAGMIQQRSAVSGGGTAAPAVGGTGRRSPKQKKGWCADDDDGDG